MCEQEAHRVPVLSDIAISSIVSGAAHSLALSAAADGNPRLFVWGSGQTGELGTKPRLCVCPAQRAQATSPAHPGPMQTDTGIGDGAHKMVPIEIELPMGGTPILAIAAGGRQYAADPTQPQCLKSVNAA